MVFLVAFLDRLCEAHTGHYTTKTGEMLEQLGDLASCSGQEAEMLIKGLWFKPSPSAMNAIGDLTKAALTVLLLLLF